MQAGKCEWFAGRQSKRCANRRYVRAGQVSQFDIVARQLRHEQQTIGVVQGFIDNNTITLSCFSQRLAPPAINFENERYVRLLFLYQLLYGFCLSVFHENIGNQYAEAAIDVRIICGHHICFPDRRIGSYSPCLEGHRDQKCE